MIMTKENYYNDNEILRFHLNHPMMSKIIRLKERDFADGDANDPLAPTDVEDALRIYETALQLVGSITAETIEANAHSVDIEGPQLIDNKIVYAKGTQQNHEIFRDSGLYGISLPRKYSGLNFPYVPYVMAAEIVSRADASFANIWGLQDCAETILEFASDELKERFLPLISKGFTCSMDLTEPDSGSDLQSVKMKAAYDEEEKCWRLNGVKRFITNGDAHLHLVLARSEEGTTDGRGLSLYLVDNSQSSDQTERGKSKPITIRRIENKLGIKGSPTAEIAFNNAKAHLIGERRLGLIKYVMSLMNGARLGVGAQSVGLSEAAYREALKYAGEREQFGSAIISFPQVKEMVVRMQAKTDAARSLLYETARYVDICKGYEALGRERSLTPEERKEMKGAQRNADMLTPVLKLFASEFANQNGYDSIQVHGGSGYMKEYKCERIYRDARVLSIYEGTSQLQVVAAQRFISNGSALKLIEEYENVPVGAGFENCMELLVKMRQSFILMCDKINLAGTSEIHSRRMVEAAGYIIMGHLLLQDASRSIDSPVHLRLTTSCREFIAFAKSEIAKSIEYIDCRS